MRERGHRTRVVVVGFAWWMGASALPGAAHSQTVDPSNTEALAPLAGPQYTPAPGQSLIGFYGTDLGFTMKHQGQLRIVFGDTWAGPLTPTIGPLGDDSQGTICLRWWGCPLGGLALPDGDAVEAFVGSGGSFFDRAGPPLVFRRNAFGLVAPLPVYDGGGLFAPLLDMGPLRTPVAVFSNARSGSASGAYALFNRGEAVRCTSTCSGGFVCATDLGVTTSGEACIDGTPGCDAAGGVCIDPTSPRGSPGPQGSLRAVVQRLRIGNADPVIQEQYYTQPWDSHKFVNASATTVDGYTITGNVGQPSVPDPVPANGATTGSEKVLLFGRPSFVGVSGQSAKLYLAVVDVPSYSATGSFAWQPLFYAGHDAAGNPTFSADETDAAALEDASGSDAEPIDIVNQMSVRYVPELGQWVMLYGGDVHPDLLELFTFGQQGLVQRDPMGSIQIRFAPEPWGPWSTPIPLFEAGDPQAGPSGQYGPGGVLHHPDCAPASQCVPGEPIFDLGLGAPVPGFLYSANLIPEWTEDRGSSVDIYWNVATFAPYQVVLMRSTIDR